MKYFLLAAYTLTSIFSIAQVPAGYYQSTSGLSCSGLKTTLKSIITNGHNPRTYGDLWTQFQVSDVKPREVGTGSAMVIWDVYSDRPGPSNDPYNFTPGTGTGGQQDQGSGGTSEGQLYNREHSVPLSWFSGSTSTPGPATDYHHIFPTDKYVNGLRANYPYGKVATATHTTQNGSKLGSSAVAGITGPVFEPIDSFKGDLARAFLYFVTRYEDNMANYAANSEAAQAFEPNTYPSVDIPYLRLMIQWHQLDPVSQKEIDRNNAAYTYQGNRNPFVDSPQFVTRVWNSSCPGLTALPVDLVQFGGKLQAENVLLEWLSENESDLARYEIEKSINGITYQKIDEVVATNSRQYSYTDKSITNRGQRIYYRLKMVDKDGSYKYSQVFSVHVPLNSKLIVYPNPVSSYMQLQLNNNVNGTVLVRITDASGKMVQQHNLKMNGNTIRLDASQLINGTYMVIVYHHGEQLFQKIMVAK
ncbi:endonuclease [Aridibaculum aurantiacum]|uniref:endonuclease n=1 Tax=Aridibaculum aurantiacum TaxID=2810307 RepID=UPI001A95798D|nr:endonuclease [Aridibaculum aurantiacum]